MGISAVSSLAALTGHIMIHLAPLTRKILRRPSLMGEEREAGPRELI